MAKTAIASIRSLLPLAETVTQKQKEKVTAKKIGMKNKIAKRVTLN